MKKSRLLTIIVVLSILVIVTVPVFAQSGMATVIKSVNFRDQPTAVGSNILDIFNVGERYSTFAKTRSGYWYQVDNYGVRGWICRDYVSLDFDVNTLPVDNSVVDQDCVGRTLTTDPNTPPPVTTPQVIIDSLPPYGVWGGYLSGHVVNIDPSQYKALCFIDAWSGWWTKPYWAWPDTYLTGNGYFSCYTTTGGVDHRATGFAVFIVPINYSTPKAYGGGIPSQLYTDAIAYVIQHRPAS